MTNTMPSACKALSPPVAVMLLPRSTSKVLFAAPNNSDMPYNMTALANTPSKKYFMPASLLLMSRLRHAASMYAGIDKNSSATKMETRSRDDVIMTMPRMLESKRNQYSPCQYSSSSTCFVDNSTTTYPAMRNIAFITTLNSSTTYRPSNIERTDDSLKPSVSTGSIAPSKVKPVSDEIIHLRDSSRNKSASNTTHKPVARMISGASAW